MPNLWTVITNKIFEALGYLFVAGIAYGIYNFTREETASSYDKNPLKPILLKGLLWCGGLALISSIVMGNPTCEEIDYPSQTCIKESDDKWEPSTDQRISNFTFFFTLLYVPVVIGAVDGKKQNIQRMKKYQSGQF
jgi:hypothetical protein